MIGLDYLNEEQHLKLLNIDIQMSASLVHAGYSHYLVVNNFLQLRFYLSIPIPGMPFLHKKSI